MKTSNTKGHVQKVAGRNPQAKKKQGMNKNEARYAEYLDADPNVVKWDYDAVRFLIGETGQQCWYRVDFKVTLRDGDQFICEYHEVKDRWKRKVNGVVVGDKVHFEDDARVKILAAASKYPEEQFRVASFSKIENRWIIDAV